ncbi:MAG: HAMP domain-containing histidine kinase [Clostridium sp.]|nr:HAMP domain-containing histidine kinase [Clostridium sp.]
MYYKDTYEFYVSFYEIEEDNYTEDISDLYDTFVKVSTENLGDRSIDWYYTNHSLKYYAKYGDDDAIQNTDRDIATGDKLIKSLSQSHMIYFSYVDGKLSYNGISEEFANYIYNSQIKNDAYTKDTDFIVSIDISGSDNPVTKIGYWSDIYYTLYNFNDLAVSVNNHFAAAVIGTILLLIASFISGFFYFSIAGKKNEESPAKLYFIDYVPFEIHFALLGGIGFGLYILLLGLVDIANTSFSKLNCIAVAVMGFALWFLLFEFSAAAARYTHSDKKVKNNFLFYQIGKLLVKGAAATGKALSYKPKRFKLNVIILSLLYVIINIAVIGLIVWLVAINVPVFAILMMVIDFGVNLFLFIKVLQYIGSLDKIIDSANKHEDLAVNINALPQSLKTLAEGMKYTNIELQNAVAQAIKDERLRTELITNVSHDLKTPLTSIITYVDLLSKCDIQDEKAREYIGVLDDKGAKLKRLIDDLIEASKVTSGNISVNLTKINLAELCLQSTVDVQPDFDKAGLELIVKNCENPPVVMADGAKAFRIIENLLSNARKYSAKASRVYVDVYKENEFGVFEIKNISAQPLDISPEELTERFVRGDKSRNQEGNGLGLSIATELCKLQNGRLELTIDGDLFKAKVKLLLC